MQTSSLRYQPLPFRLVTERKWQPPLSDAIPPSRIAQPRRYKERFIHFTLALGRFVFCFSFVKLRNKKSLLISIFFPHSKLSPGVY